MELAAVDLLAAVKHGGEVVNSALEDAEQSWRDNSSYGEEPVRRTRDLVCQMCMGGAPPLGNVPINFDCWLHLCCVLGWVEDEIADNRTRATNPARATPNVT